MTMSTSTIQPVKMSLLNRIRSLSDIPQLKPPFPAKETSQMEQKTARLTVLIDPTKKEAFERLCATQDVTPSQVVRQLIREYLEKHGVTYANRMTHDDQR